MMQKEPILMVASDIDGTLSRSDGTISSYTVEAIHAAQAKGVLFTVCSGRYPEHADVLLKRHGIRCPITGNNGSTQWDARTDTVLRDHFMDPAAAHRAYEVAEELHLDYMVFCRKYVATRNGKVLHSSQANYGQELQRDYGIVFETGKDAVKKALAMPINKFYFHYDTPDERQYLRDALQAVPEISITTSGPFNVELISKACSKAGGVREMAELYGIDMKNVMAIGDYENDVPMLKSAGFGVAMGNSSPDVQRQADAVTATNDEDGVARAIEKYVLQATAYK